ncbi:receptor kinase-like protein Xa21 [Cornus florida]|uniref:receptor kinase-like protein Xa21 n=1 Tax=Cornus florida TaxID=4283 RepID=UPI00289CF81E|nr:receptor kinase-like protein Xa21 [Cornus florida]
MERNPLNGILPVSIGNLSTLLQDIQAGDCEIKGNIPNHISNLTNLFFLRLHGNGFTGSIPTTIKKLPRLQILDLGYNRIQGPIPNGLCYLKNLASLDLSENELVGPIPTCLGDVTFLRELFLGANKLTSTINLFSLKDILKLNLSSNSLRGSLPSQIGSLKAAIQIDLSHNRFSGDIASTIGGLQSLINLSLAHNGLQGPIPMSFGNLISLEFLDLSYNNLSGVIPKPMESLLHHFNASFNRLRGEIPSRGPFANFTNQSFMANEALCGAPQLQVLPCNAKRETKLQLKWSFLPTSAHRRITYQELLYATEGFSDSNLLGTGSLSSVYRGTFKDGTIMAIKVFNLQLEVASKSFDTECEMLCNLRHRNLTKVISGCSNLHFKALVLQYMPNGSLKKWLYSHNYFLDMLQRLDIMIDLACALDYLHHGNSIPVVHCDLKPNNVLLDEDMVAHHCCIALRGETIYSSMISELGLKGTTHHCISLSSHTFETNTSLPPSNTCSLSTSPPAAAGWDYEVFLSFRGDDTSKRFSDRLYCYLREKGIHTFRDDKALRLGENISEILNAIEHSKISIHIFSEDYASSEWCLRELTKMVECKTTREHIIIPIFYDVKPSAVREQKESYEEAFRRILMVILCRVGRRH